MLAKAAYIYIRCASPLVGAREGAGKGEARGAGLCLVWSLPWRGLSGVRAMPG